MIAWLRKWAINIVTFGQGTNVYVEREWRSCHFSTTAARKAARQASVDRPGAYCLVIQMAYVIARYQDGEFLCYPGQVTQTQLIRLLAEHKS